MFVFNPECQIHHQDSRTRREFRPLQSETDFLLASFYFEENDVPALRGVAALLQNAAVKDAITGTMGDEGYHGGFIRLAVRELGYVERRSGRRTTHPRLSKSINRQPTGRTAWIV
jgi:Ferritin-like domain